MVLNMAWYDDVSTYFGLWGILDPGWSRRHLPFGPNWHIPLVFWQLIMGFFLCVQQAPCLPLWPPSAAFQLSCLFGSEVSTHPTCCLSLAPWTSTCFLLFSWYLSYHLDLTSGPSLASVFECGPASRFPNSMAQMSLKLKVHFPFYPSSSICVFDPIPLWQG